MIVLVLLLYATTAERIVAKVGGNLILQNEIDEAAVYFSLQLGARPDEIKERLLNDAIERRLLLLEAEKESLSVEKEEVERMLEQTIEDIGRRFPSREDFEAALKNENLTIDELKNRSRKEAAEKLLVNRLIEKRIAPTISVSPTELRRYYEAHKESIAVRPATVKVRHIMIYIKPGEATILDAARRIGEVQNLLARGGSFATLAREFSEDENSRRRGGMLGKIKRGETFEEFEKAVWPIKPGEISQPFQTRLGFHIVEVLNRDKESMLLRQILIKVKPNAQDAARAKELAGKVRDLIKDDSTFEAAAKKYSDEPEHDLGEYVEDQIRPPFDEVVKKVPAGQASEPFETPIGYHILYVAERIESKILTFDEIRDQLQGFIYQLKLKEKYDLLIANLRKEIFVQVME